MIGLFLTILFPGLGHFYYGKNLRGVMFVGISFIPFVYPIALILALLDVYKISKSGIKPELSSKREAIIVIILCFGLPIVFFFSVVVIGPKVFHSTLFYIEGRTNPKKNRETMNDIVRGLERYYSSYQHYPEDLIELVKDNPLRKRWLSDPWGHPYIYEVDSNKESYKLISLGKDGKQNTGDDVIVKEGVGVKP